MIRNYLKDDMTDFEEAFRDWCATTHPTELLDNVIYMLIQLKEDWEDDDDWAWGSRKEEESDA